MKQIDLHKDNPEELEIINIGQSRDLSLFIDHYDDLKLEKIVAHKGLLISVYSLLEDCLLKFALIVKKVMNITSTFDEVCKRDKGVFRYVKYIEKACDVNIEGLKNSNIYQEIHIWNKIRNHFVHVGDYVNADRSNLIQELERLNVSIYKGRISLNEQNLDIMFNTVDYFMSKVIEACWFKMNIKIIPIDYI